MEQNINKDEIFGEYLKHLRKGSIAFIKENKITYFVICFFSFCFLYFGGVVMGVSYLLIFFFLTLLLSEAQRFQKKKK